MTEQTQRERILRAIEDLPPNKKERAGIIVALAAFRMPLPPDLERQAVAVDAGTGMLRNSGISTSLLRAARRADNERTGRQLGLGASQIDRRAEE